MLQRIGWNDRMHATIRQLRGDALNMPLQVRFVEDLEPFLGCDLIIL